ncbi:MAG: redoxin domain-containing protein [Candidatus Eremiobacteraeota bacterium]|nr:redoxin domain-containing protein [Candidatus Eremiobacteraeota bacterium]
MNVRSPLARNGPALSAFAAAVTLAIVFSAPATIAAPTLEPLVRHGDWLAARPSSGDLRGRVVIVDVFTFGCYNCRNVTPNLRALYKAHRGDGLAIVGVHTPETPYETERANVVTNLAKQGITWPVAIDNSHTLWDAFGVQYWPTQLIFDKHGTLRKTVVGDSQDAAVDATVTQLLAEK